MRIIFFQIVVKYGGAFRSLVELARRLNEHVDVAVVDVYGRCKPFAEAVRKAELEYHVLIPGGRMKAIGRHPIARLTRVLEAVPKMTTIGRRAKRLLGDLEPTVVWTNDLRSAFPIGFFPSLRHIPLVVHMRGWYTPDMMPNYNRWLANRRCAALLAVSYQTRTAMTCCGINPRKIHVLHNPLDVDELLALAARPLAKPLPQANRPLRLLLPGTITRAKGLHTAVAAMRRLRDTGHDAVLWLAGDLDWGEQDYIRETRQLAQQLGVADRVEWLGRRDDMPQVMKAATCVVLPSHSEGHPRVSLEAMGLGKPFLATPVGGILDMILPGVTGMLFEIEDDQELATCVDALVRDPERAARIGQLAQDYVRQNFSPAQQVARALAIATGVATQASRTITLPAGSS